MQITKTNPSNDFKLQSPYLYCQAAGSDGSDNSTSGIHLRWDLLKELGEKHIPKGNSTNTPNGAFNKAAGNDFVTIYRTKFRRKYFIAIDFENMDDLDTESESNGGWHDIQLLPGWQTIQYKHSSSNADAVLFHFMDEFQLQQYVLTHGPDIFRYFGQLLKDYTGIIEIEIKDKLMFAYEFTSRVMYSHGAGDANGAIKYESVSLKDTSNVNSAHVIARKYIFENQARNNYPENETCFAEFNVGENMKYIRVQHTPGYFPLKLALYTYVNYMEGTNRNDAWQKFGGDEYEGFAITLLDQIAYNRIEGSDAYQNIDVINPEFNIQWRKYLEDDMMVPINYVARWNSENGMKDTLTEFITLSNTDPKANMNSVPAEDDPQQALSFSLLDMLKIAAVDYHAARIFGLGAIDPGDSLDENEQYIYAAVYTTDGSLPGITGSADHVYMTLPTGMQDYMLPVPPNFTDITYGVITQPTGSVSDENGYSNYYDLRFVNLNKENNNVPQPLLPFIPDNMYLDTTRITQPVSFGIKYRQTNVNAWEKPELVYDEEYIAGSGMPENSAVIDQGGSPLFTHLETNAGYHRYALYSINWFSRASGLSNEQQTDLTVFKVHNRLLPPSNFSVQYLQEEEPLILTSESEQDYIKTNPDEDYRTRVTFEWDNSHINAFQYADKAEFFYRTTPLLKIEGKIKKVEDFSDFECTVFTTSFQIASSQQNTEIKPVIPAGQENLFIGSSLCTSTGHFIITAIIQPAPGTNDGPAIRVKKIIFKDPVQPEDEAPVLTSIKKIPPNEGDIFFFFENNSNISQWTKLNKTVKLYRFQPANTRRPFYENETKFDLEFVDGIIDTAATVAKIITTYPDDNNPDTPPPPAPAFEGAYSITFSGTTETNLPDHPDPDVSWYRGSAIIQIAGSMRKKKLPVIAITSNNPLQIIVFDEDYLNEGTVEDPTDAIKEGDDVWVNYYPGYKVYLYSEPGFDNTKLLPSGSDNSKKTYFASRSIDIEQALESPLTPTAVILSKNIQKPEKPEGILASLFTTRPDTYGKSTYTLDVKLKTNNRSPYGFMIYRANEMDILNVLYKHDTIKLILSQLAGINNDEFVNRCWVDLIDVKLEGTALFYSQNPELFRFPVPDNPDTIIYVDLQSGSPFVIDAELVPSHPFPLDGITLEVASPLIQLLIDNAFTPLTDTAIIFDYVKIGIRTSPNPPRTRDMIGRLLNPNGSDFDPFPMAVKLPNSGISTTVRFTDFNIQGTSRNIYFYYAREISVEMKYSERTDIVGPVRLVDASPAEKPVIRKILSQEAGANTNTAVVFELANYISSEAISKYEIYRTTDFEKTASTKTMELAGSYTANNIISDEFTNLEFPPFGMPIYYRIVALRKIRNENNQIEFIPSKPSEILLASVIDVNNPQPPQISASTRTENDGPNGSISALTNVKLSWRRTAYNGKYYLYKMNSVGNWEMLWQRKTNSEFITVPESNVSFPTLERLPKIDEDGNAMYHRFKVSVQNANGLFNLEENELVL
ncbi:MAG TPA: hypothetical protein PKC39_02220 [Ferruginibacter sp.]|nr:hypothetical protein [Ferruginibacter sp.]HMP19751.1 hypothetical protein [Ferruginibacter sp.]